MDITLTRAAADEAKLLHEMQVRAFRPLLAVYDDQDTSPVNEPLENIRDKITRPGSDFYIVRADDEPVGGIRIVTKEDGRCRVSIAFILPEWQNRGIAQTALRQVESLYAGARIWELDTIAQEQRLCHLYEKMGYRLTGESKAVNDRLTLVYYEKSVE